MSAATSFVACIAIFTGWLALEPQRIGFKDEPATPTAVEAESMGGVDVKDWAETTPLTNPSLLSLIFLPPLTLLVDALVLLFGLCWVPRQFSHATISEEACAAPTMHDLAEESSSAMSSDAEVQVEELREQLASAERAAEAREAALRAKVNELQMANQLKSTELVRISGDMRTSLADAEEQKRLAFERTAELEAQLFERTAEFEAQLLEALVFATSCATESEDNLQAAVSRAEQAEASAAKSGIECDGLRSELALLRAKGGGKIVPVALASKAKDTERPALERNSTWPCSRRTCESFDEEPSAVVGCA
eukprot:TRINITY_DN55611_c0_g1_i1.p1 TRINITY_DN55611_c0_g1~~TRINITY_DN55611_c0_g1_i1.p1  ORF type:complete len:308 (+),score=72.53 TRINITY_DN55611_c0_g1_i1:106-1029(+)